ncbi:hypothetical protein G4V62_05115 [Bacillaceae bacterium SIJ1]|uniref:hypothetical protein n=1 Tax=Litoribacterium kuwaitense TaxID=1398745 RepID=UPI0013EA0235|nr:hypothetical protein [Litoribacterium kuwaitense]NGP44365.1 hypothetical protein [Litoribacterium kuwaitense]
MRRCFDVFVAVTSLLLFTLIPMSNVQASFTATWFIEGNHIYIETYLKNHAYRSTHAEHKRTSPGKVMVSVDGDLVDTFESGAFILTNVAPGRHDIELTLVPTDITPYNEKESFTVLVPHA